MINILFKTIGIFAILVLLFNIEGVSSLEVGKKNNARKLRLSRRAFAAPDAEKVVSTAETGVMGLLAALQHTVDNEYKLMQAKPAAVPSPNTGTTAKVSPGFKK